MTNLGGQELQKRLASLKTGRARNSPNKIEAAFLTYAEMPSFETPLNALEELEDCAGVRVYRHEVLHVLKTALRAASVGDKNFYEATVLARERNRHLGRRTNRVAVGSTLLLKGLEDYQSNSGLRTAKQSHEVFHGFQLLGCSIGRVRALSLASNFHPHNHADNRKFECFGQKVTLCNF